MPGMYWVGGHIFFCSPGQHAFFLGCCFCLLLPAMMLLGYAVGILRFIAATIIALLEYVGIL